MMQTKLLKYCVVVCLSVLLLTEQIPSAVAQANPGDLIVAQVSARVMGRPAVAILTVLNNRLDVGGRLRPLAGDTAAVFRSRGYSVATLEEANVARAAYSTIGRSGTIGRASMGSFANALNVGVLILFAAALAANARENEMSVTASIYASTKGALNEVWRSNIPWRASDSSQRPTGSLSNCSGNLLINGSFDRDWEPGWMRTYGDTDGGSSLTEVAHGARSNLLHMKHEGLSYVTLLQTVRVPRGRIFLGFEATFKTWEGPIMGFTGTGTGGIGVLLLDSRKEPIGMVWNGSYVANPFEGTGLVGVPQSPRNTGSTAFFQLPNGRTVRQRIDISKIARDRLGRIDLARVEYVTVTISVGATHNSAGAEAWVDDLVLDVCP